MEITNMNKNTPIKKRLKQDTQISVEGLHLWRVQTTVFGVAPLLITTQAPEVDAVPSKARAFMMKRHAIVPPRGFIQSIKYEGTIDA
jgi:hypothetical protein